MAWLRAETTPLPSPERAALAAALRPREVWRRAGWWVAVAMVLWGCALGAVGLGACLAWLGAGVPGRWLAEVCLGGAAIGSLASLAIFLTPWRHAPAAAALQGLAGLADDDLLTAAEVLDGRAMVSAGLAAPLLRRARALAARVRAWRLFCLGPWRQAEVAAAAAAALLVVSLALPGAWARLMAEAPAPAVATGPAAPIPQAPAPVPAPALTAFSLHVEPPAYTGRPALDLSRPASFQAPAGSLVTLHATFADCTAGRVVLGETKAEAPHGDLTADATLARTFAWSLEAKGPGGSAQLGPFTARALPDGAPSVELQKPAADLGLPEPDLVPVVVSAKDDYGLARVALQWRRVPMSQAQATAGKAGAGKTSAAPPEPWHDIDIATGAGRAWQGDVAFDLRTMGLLAGDAVLLRASATDNNQATAPQTAYSAVRRITITAAAKADQDRPVTATDQAAAREDEAWQQLRGNLQEMDATLKQMEEQIGSQASQTAPKSSASGGGSAAGGALSQDLAEQQAELRDLAGRLKKSSEQAKAAMSDAERRLKIEDMVDQQMLDKVAELHRLADQVLDKQLKQMLDKLAELVKDQNLSKLRVDAAQLREMHDKFMRQLDQTLDLLKRAQLEALLNALQNKIKDLANRQEKSLGRTEKMQAGDQAARQEAERQGELARETGPLPEEMRLAGQRAKELDPQTSQKLDELARQMAQSDPAGDMRQATEALQRQAPTQATGHQRDALGKLRKAAGDVAGLQAQAMARRRQELQAEAGRAVADAMALAQAQIALQQQSDKVTSQPALPQSLAQKDTLERLAGRQQAIADGAQRGAERLRRLAGKTPAASPGLAARMEAVAATMAQAARYLQGGEGGPARLGQQRALGQLNRLAADLAALQQAVGKQSAASALSEYLQSLEQLAEQQRSLNAKSQQAGNGNPLLSELGQQQAMMRAALDKLMRASGQEFSDKLGGVGKGMDQVAGDLNHRRLTPNTKNLQRDILHKMLDAQRSLYTRDQQSRQRQAERPRPWTPPPSPPALRSTGPPKLKLPPSQETAQGRVPSAYQDAANAYERRISGGR